MKLKKYVTLLFLKKPNLYAGFTVYIQHIVRIHLRGQSDAYLKCRVTSLKITLSLQFSELRTASFTHRTASGFQSPSGTVSSAKQHLVA